MENFDGLIFAVNGVVKRLAATDVDASMKLVAYLRDDLGLRGTKIGCGEGGCGSCCVLLTRFDPLLQKVVTVSANACLRPLVTLHGHNITTIEGIGGPTHPSGGFHAVQRRLHDMSASQCGYCTPGFAVAIYSQLGQKPESSMVEMEAALDGNLCRCTGYRPIMDAAKSFAVDHFEASQNSLGGAVQAELDAQFPAELRDSIPQCGARFGSQGSDFRYLRADTLQQAVDYFESNRFAKFSCAQTSAGMYKQHLSSATCLIDVSGIAELRAVNADSSALTIGAATPFATFAGLLLQDASRRSEATRNAFCAVADVVGRIANHHVRNVASIGGNLSMCKELGFASDLATPLCAVGAHVNVVTFSRGSEGMEQVTIPLLEYLAAPSQPEGTALLVSLTIPVLCNGTVLRCYRTAIRCVNGHAIANAAFRAHVGEGGALGDVEVVYGAVGEFDQPGRNAPRRNDDAVAMLRGQALGKELVREVEANFQAGDFVVGAYKRSHRQRLVKAYLLQFIHDLRGTATGRPPMSVNEHPLHSANPKFTLADASVKGPVSAAIPRPDGIYHASGTAVFISDMKEPKDALFAAYVLSRVATGAIKSVPRDAIMGQDRRVVDVVTAKDLPPWCHNRVHNVGQYFGHSAAAAPHYELMASSEVNHCGQIVAAVLATNLAAAQLAAKRAATLIEYEEAQGKPVISIADALEAGRPLVTRRVIDEGCPHAVLQNKELHHSLTTIQIGSQKHFYMETHCAFAVPHDHKIDVFCPTQAPTYMHQAVAEALGAPMSEVNFQHYRCGGSFGAKVAADHAVMAAVLAKMTGRAVKVHLDRNTDMQFQGGREETEVSALVDFDSTGKLHAVHLRALKNLGVRQDVSSFPVAIAFPNTVMDCYNVPARFIDSAGVITSLASRTMVRAPGELEAAVVGEAVVDLIAFELGIHGTAAREVNLRRSAIAADVNTIPQMWDRLMDREGWRERVRESEEFNTSSAAIKKGVALTPFSYGVGVRQAHVLINIYPDGSVVVHHSGCENGQGLNIKVLQAACSELSKVVDTALPLELFRSGGNQTHTLPNQGVTGGSTGSESSCLAAIDGAQQLASRLMAVRDELADPAQRNDWRAICRAALAKKVSLSAHGSCDGTAHDPPLQYRCFAVGAAAVTLDVATGQVNVDRFDLQYDAGRSLNPAVDIGQCEGAIMMGLGLMLLEDAHTNPATGWLEHDGTWDYKVPTALDVPTEFNVQLISNEEFTRGVLSSKASGEPPICTTPAIASAVRQCVISARKDAGLGGFPEMPIPMTPDRVTTACGAFCHPVE